MSKEKPKTVDESPDKKEPIDQAEVWASRDIPEDAESITQAGPTYTNPNEDEHL